MRVGFNARRVENLRTEIAAEEPPLGAVRSRVYIVLVTRYEGVCRESRWAVSEYGTFLDKSFVRERAVGNEDCWAEANVNGDDGSVLGMEFADYVFEFGEGFAEHQKVAEYWDVKGSRRKLISFLEEKVKEGFENG